MSNPAQRQRKLAAKAAKRKVIVAEKKRLEVVGSSLASRVRVAAKGPVVACKLAEALFVTGLGQFVIARRLPSGLMGCALLLIDVHCLGVKQAVYQEMDSVQLRDVIKGLNETQNLTDVDPAYARKLIRDVSAYAAALGLACVAEDLPVIEAIFGEIDADTCTDKFIFGQDGKPFYFRGPNETMARARNIVNTLTARLGIGGFNYMIADEPDF